MNEKEEMIPKEEALGQLRLALRRASLLYHYFAKTLIDQFGEEEGNRLVRKAIDAYGKHIGEDARRKAEGRRKRPSSNAGAFRERPSDARLEDGEGRR